MIDHNGTTEGPTMSRQRNATNREPATAHDPGMNGQSRNGSTQRLAAGRNEINFPMLTSAALNEGDFQETWLVEDTLVAGQPMIVAAPSKSMKTTLLIDLVLSLSMGLDFLGKFKVPRAVRVLFLSAESGLSTLQKSARAIARSKGCELSDAAGLFWCAKPPQLAHAEHLAAITDIVRNNEIEVLVCDPVYLMLGTGGNEASLFAMGELLSGINAICQEAGVTLILVHHCKKTGIEAGEPIEFSGIAWAGFEQFARQWLLISRREPYQPEQPGLHKLWLNIGGSAGHSNLLGLDIDEGPHHSRRWEVDVLPAREIRRDKQGEMDRKRAVKAAAQIERDHLALVQAAAKHRDGETLKTLRTRAGFGGTRSDLALKSALDAGDLVPVEIIKPPRKTPFQGYKLAPERGAT